MAFLKSLDLWIQQLEQVLLVKYQIYREEHKLLFKDFLMSKVRQELLVQDREHLGQEEMLERSIRIFLESAFLDPSFLSILFRIYFVRN